MTIRNLITAAAVAGLIGLSGAVAYADDTDSHIDDQGFRVAADANYPGTVFVSGGDADVYEGEILSGGHEQADVDGLSEKALEIK